MQLVEAEVITEQDFNPWELENIYNMEMESVLEISSWLEMNVTSNCSND